MSQHEIERRSKRRRQKELTLPEKVNLIERAASGNSTHSALADEYGVSAATVSRILKRKEEYLGMAKEDDSGRRRRKFRSDGHWELNNLVLQWYKQRRKEKMKITGTLMREQALTFARALTLTDFKASNGWLDSFRTRHNLPLINNLSNESASEDHRWNEEQIDEIDDSTRLSLSSIYTRTKESKSNEDQENEKSKRGSKSSTSRHNESSDIYKILQAHHDLMREIATRQKEQMHMLTEMHEEIMNELRSYVDGENQRWEVLFEFMQKQKDMLGMEHDET